MMTTFSDKNIRIFMTKSDVDLSKLHRKRSSGRLKSIASTTDNRAWGCDVNDRRQYFLEYFKTYDTNVGNYVPIEVIFGMLSQLSREDKGNMLDDSLSRLKDVIAENEKYQSELADLRRRLKELENQDVVTMLKNERDHLRNELDNLRNVHYQLKEAEQRIAELQCEIENIQKSLETAECKSQKMAQKTVLQKEYIRKLNETLASAQKVPCTGGSTENLLPDTYCKTIKEMQCEMNELRKKVTEQSQTMMSQRNCLSVQHKYITELEHEKTSMEKRLLERKQEESMCERNSRNEITLLKEQLNSYIRKNQLLEKSAGQLFDTAKCGKYDEEEFLDMPSFTRTGYETNSNKFTRPVSKKSHFGSESLGRGKISSCCSNPANRLNRLGEYQSIFPANKSGCFKTLESSSNDNFRTFMTPTSSFNKINCTALNDECTKKNSFMPGQMLIDSVSSISVDNCQQSIYNSQLPVFNRGQFNSTMCNIEQEPYMNNDNYSKSFNINESQNPNELG